MHIFDALICRFLHCRFHVYRPISREIRCRSCGCVRDAGESYE